MPDARPTEIPAAKREPPTAGRTIPLQRRWRPLLVKPTWGRGRLLRRTFPSAASQPPPMSRKSLVSRPFSPIPPPPNSSPTTREVPASGRSGAWRFAWITSSQPCLPANDFLSRTAPFRQNGRAVDNGRHPSSLPQLAAVRRRLIRLAASANPSSETARPALRVLTHGRRRFDSPHVECAAPKSTLRPIHAWLLRPSRSCRDCCPPKPSSAKPWA